MTAMLLNHWRTATDRGTATVTKKKRQHDNYTRVRRTIALFNKDIEIRKVLISFVTVSSMWKHYLLSRRLWMVDFMIG